MVSKAVNRNFGMTCNVRQHRHLLTAKAKAFRAERCPKLLSFIKHKGAGKTLVFVNKEYTVDTEIPQLFEWSTLDFSQMMLFNSTDSGSSTTAEGLVNSSPLMQTLQPIVVNTTLNSTSYNGTESCDVWQDVQHILFQLGSLCMAFSFLTPISFQYHILFLRCLLLFTFLFYILWAGVFICVPDILGWNCAFFCINIGHIFYLAYSMYPVHIHKDFEDVYAKLFKPLGVSRIEFKSLTRVGRLVYLRQGSVYATEGITPCGEKLSLLLRGR
uniref:POPDC1-3 domain-containing protein n=1 Tax=Octopus bimaculoides TaxID=37653 RepID=A0A0L8HBL9_OCTBM